MWPSLVCVCFPSFTFFSSQIYHFFWIPELFWKNICLLKPVFISFQLSSRTIATGFVWCTLFPFLHYLFKRNGRFEMPPCLVLRFYLTLYYSALNQCWFVFKFLSLGILSFFKLSRKIKVILLTFLRNVINPRYYIFICGKHHPWACYIVCWLLFL